MPWVLLRRYVLQWTGRITRLIILQGSALGGALQSIMLNKLFHGPVGFHAGVRANAALNFGLLAIALLLMKPKPNTVSRKQGSLRRELFVFMSDPPYVFMVMGYVVTFGRVRVAHGSPIVWSLFLWVSTFRPSSFNSMPSKMALLLLSHFILYVLRCPNYIVVTNTPSW